jgi:putative pyruvate formate lyase activating enzyme
MRPDAVRVWRLDEIRSRFQRYYAIAEKQKVAYYLITKKVPLSLEVSADTPLEKLWDEHNHARGKFLKLLREVDAQTLAGNYLNSIDTPKNSFLDLKIEIAYRILRKCHFCERFCEVNREETKGTCRLGADAYVSSWFHHMGEEAPLIPSGTKN